MLTHSVRAIEGRKAGKAEAACTVLNVCINYGIGRQGSESEVCRRQSLFRSDVPLQVSLVAGHCGQTQVFILSLWPWFGRILTFF